MSRFRTFAAHSLTHAAFAFTLMGGWAVYANRMHEMPAPIIAGLVQGAISATITIALKRIIDVLHARTGSALACIITASLFSLLTISILHRLAGTPELLTTITVPWLVGITYVTSYTLSIRRKKVNP